MESSHPNSHANDEPHGTTESSPHHRVPYFFIFGALIILTLATLAIAQVRFQNELMNVMLAIFVAVLKASLVALFFMHLKFEGKLIYLILIVPLVFCVIIVTSLIPDVTLTHADSNSASMHLFNPPPVWHNK
jgi:cytochrome c oxidase subunit IV